MQQTLLFKHSNNARALFTPCWMMGGIDTVKHSWNTPNHHISLPLHCDKNPKVERLKITATVSVHKSGVSDEGQAGVLPVSPGVLL